MSLPVFLSAEASGASTGSVVELSGDEGRHAVVVRRIRVGEQIILTDGAGVVATCSVDATAKSSLTARVLEVSVAPREEPVVTVVQAIPKGDRGELAVEMLTEVGVDRIVPWAASRCVAVWRGDRVEKSLAKWRATAREAAKQARRAWLPEVTDLATTADVAGRVAGAALAVILHEEADAPLGGLGVPGTGEIVVVVGPEGGLTPEEIAGLTAAGGVPAAAGPTVLRTSTAGVVAASVLLSRSRRW